MVNEVKGQYSVFPYYFGASFVTTLAPKHFLAATLFKEAVSRASWTCVGSFVCKDFCFHGSQSAFKHSLLEKNQGSVLTCSLASSTLLVVPVRLLIEARRLDIMSKIIVSQSFGSIYKLAVLSESVRSVFLYHALYGKTSPLMTKENILFYSGLGVVSAPLEHLIRRSISLFKVSSSRLDFVGVFRKDLGQISALIAFKALAYPLGILAMNTGMNCIKTLYDS